MGGDFVNLYCILYIAGMKKSGNYCMCFLFITNGKRISMNLAECAFTLYLQNSIGTIKLLSHCHTLASFLGLPHFYHPIASTVIHRSGLPLLYIIVNANGSQKQKGLGTRLVTLYPCFFICASLFSLSYSWTDTCPLTKNVLDYASQILVW